MAKILVTAGPTREHIDDVRYLTNGSTGRMGFAIAAAAAAAGHTVVLVAGPTELPTPPGVERIDVISAREMHDRARAAFGGCDVAIGAAAVADHRPAQRLRGKPPKSAAAGPLVLAPNPDVIAALGAVKGARIVVGFALEAEDGDLDAALERARRKLAAKHLDLVVVNTTGAIGSTDSRVVLLGADGAREDLPAQAKSATAAVVVDRALALLDARREGSG